MGSPSRCQNCKLKVRCNTANVSHDGPTLRKTAYRINTAHEDARALRLSPMTNIQIYLHPRSYPRTRWLRWRTRFASRSSALTIVLPSVLGPSTAADPHSRLDPVVWYTVSKIPTASAYQSAHTWLQRFHMIRLPVMLESGMLGTPLPRLAACPEWPAFLPLPSKLFHAPVGVGPWRLACLIQSYHSMNTLTSS